MRIKTFDLCLHKPSNKYYLVRYCYPDNFYFKTGYNRYFNNIEMWETNKANWSIFNDKVGGVYAGGVMKLIAKRFSLKWFINLYLLFKQV